MSGEKTEKFLSLAVNQIVHDQDPTKSQFVETTKMENQGTSYGNKQCAQKQKMMKDSYKRIVL